MFAFLFLLPAVANAPDTMSDIPVATIHPFTAEYYRCAEHAEGELPYVGDALGQDCAIRTTDTGFGGEGKRNEDYDSWNALLLAPADSTIVRVKINPVVNIPGILGKPPASTITFQRDDGVKIIYAHVQGVMVKEGEHVRAGQPVAHIGNNGMSTSPHLHVGAWKDQQPYQIRWDLRALGELRRAAKAAKEKAAGAKTP